MYLTNELKDGHHACGPQPRVSVGILHCCCMTIRDFPVTRDMSQSKAGRVSECSFLPPQRIHKSLILSKFKLSIFHSFTLITSVHPSNFERQNPAELDSIFTHSLYSFDPCTKPITQIHHAPHHTYPFRPTSHCDPPLYPRPSNMLLSVGWRIL